MTLTRQEKTTLIKEKLEAAIGLIVSVQKEMNTKSALCEDCGHVRYENFDEHQADRALSGVITRLRKTIRVLGAPERRAKKKA